MEENYFKWSNMEYVPLVTAYDENAEFIKFGLCLGLEYLS